MSNRVLFSPVPRTLAWSSLGFHCVSEGLGPCETATIEADSAAPRSDVTGRTLGEFDFVLASLAWELEVPAMVSALRASGIEPLRRLRPGRDPLVIAGGPLTLSNPDLLDVVADAVFVGEADDRFQDISLALDQAGGRQDALERLAAIPGMHVNAIHGDASWPGPVSARAHGRLPVRSSRPKEPNEFGNAFLVEVGRGCPRGCTFCVVRRGEVRAAFHSAADILAAIPEAAPRAGLLGAAVSDHPALLPIVETLVSRGCAVTLGSVRADRVSPELLDLLVRTGLRTLTVAADGASESMRTSIRKGITAEHLESAAAMARAAGVGRMRVYAMIGLPDETDDDVRELADLLVRMSGRIRLSLSVSSFVPKRFTPLQDAPFGPVSSLKNRLALLRRLVGRSVDVRAGSPREALLEHALSHARGSDAERLVLS